MELKTPGWGAILGLIVLTACPGLSSVYAGSAAILITPQSALMDEEIAIQVTGLPPQKLVSLRARMQWHGQAWEAHASFVTDSLGKVDLTAQAPASGSYVGKDRMGLFWAMKPDAARSGEKSHGTPSVMDARVTRFELELDGRQIAAAQCQRWLARPGVRRRDVREQGLIGRLYEPPEQGRHAAVLVLSGSEGACPVFCTRYFFASDGGCQLYSM